jgi:uncharacterized membrane protein
MTTFLKAKIIDVVPRKTIDENDKIEQLLVVSFVDSKGTQKTVTLENDRSPQKKESFVYLQEIAKNDTDPKYVLHEIDRTPVLGILGLLFLCVIVVFGGKKGMRGLVSLGVSVALIFYMLVPLLVSGVSPVFASIATASLIVISSAYITHGVSRITTAAVYGMVGSVLISGIIGYFAFSYGSFTGLAEDDAFSLSVASLGKLDVRGVVFGGVIIGLLGTLYDAAISQSVLVAELLRSYKNKTRKFIITRALHVGKTHVGALVDTLVLAYIGVSLPLIVLVSYLGASEPISILLSKEIFALEIVRTLVGSIGLVLSVPLTTVIAAYMLKKDEDTKDMHVCNHVH